ncbi:MAG: cellulase family glycosylhydrolase [Pseudomonadota bacterium]
MLRLLVFALAFICVAAPARADLAIRDGQLVERDGAPFVMRGINIPHAWAPEHTARSIDDIAATGANTVRIALSAGVRWKRNEPSEVARLIAHCRRRHLIVILEVHDATGFGADSRAAHLGAALAYWGDLRAVLRGQEDYVLINIANEPFAGSATPAMWIEAHRTAIATLRGWGLRHTLVIDGADYGQDRSGTMRDHARELLDSDPLRNVLFSIHMYQVYGRAEMVEAYFNAFHAAHLPLIVGEFGPDHQGEPVDEDTIMRMSAQQSVGYLGWSWGGNGGNVANLDMVEHFDASRLSPWGERIINGANGIRATARPAHIFQQRRGFLAHFVQPR